MRSSRKNTICAPPDFQKYSCTNIQRESVKRNPECGIKNCAISAHFDVPYYGRPFKNKLKSPRFTLGSPVGLIHSSDFINSEFISSRVIMDRYACLLKAFAKLYILDETKWTGSTIDEVLQEGERLFLDSVGEEDLTALEVTQRIESQLQIRREFDYENTLFHIEFDPKFQGLKNGEPVLYGDHDDEDIKSDFYAGDLPLTEFKRTISEFFKVNKYGLVHFKLWHLLIWKAHGIYFVLDLFGRRLGDLITDHEGNGFATMISLRTLDNVAYLVLKCSNFNDTETFSIREIRMVRLGFPDGLTVTRTYGKRKKDYILLRNDYAVLKSNLHMSLNRANVFRNRSALAVGIAAILASKIDHPATWSTADLDKIFCYGAYVCRNCIENCMNGNRPITLGNFPNNLKMGQFWINYHIEPSKYEGVWKCVPYQRQGELYDSLKQAFDDGETAVLVQVSFQMYTIIKKKNFYYLLDPYLHKVKGMTDTIAEDPKSATLRMFCHFDTMMNVLHDLLLANTRTNKFYLHPVKVKDISESEEHPSRQKSEQDNECPEDGDDDFDVKSLNDYICFDIDDRKCLKEFGQPSDFEEEEEEIPWSEYEEEEVPGEEEEGGPED